MKIKEHIVKFGARKTARAIVDVYIFRGCGMGLDDMPESPALCDIIDEVEDIISQKEIDVDALRDALECLRDADYVYDMLH